MLTLFRDISFARRQIAKHHVYALTAILSMALGIGATAAVYSVLSGVLIDPYPIAMLVAWLSVTIQNERELRQGHSLDPF